MSDELSDATAATPRSAPASEPEQCLPDGIGMSVESVRALLAKEHDISVPRDDPFLMTVTIQNAFLEEQDRLRKKHEKALAAFMGEQTAACVRGVEKSVSELRKTLSDVTINGIRDAASDFSATLSGFRSALYLCTAIMALSALVNVAVFVLKAAHHAIIPTGEAPVNLTEKEQRLYGMIALGYILQFYPALRYEAQKISVTIKDTQWEARGRCILEPGWTACGEEEDEEKKEKDQALPAVRNGDAVNCTNVDILKKKTTPPPRFTEGSLIEAMANVHRFVTDAEARATLRENEGIGTEATRAGILETLKARKYLKPEGKALVSTALAGQVIGLAPPLLKDPVTTAQWESKLEAIAQGENTLEAFMADQIRIVPELVAGIFAADVKGLTGSGPVHLCPECGKALRKRQGRDGNGDWWGCTGYPECRVTLPDDHGKPGKREARTASEYPCPVCGNPLYPGKNDRGPFWSCYNKAGHADGKPVFLPDDDGKPGAPREKTPRTRTEFLCPKCGKPLELHHDVSKKSGRPYDWYGCSGYPACRERFFAGDGKPDFGGR